MKPVFISYPKTNAFSNLVNDYLMNDSKVCHLFDYGFDENGVHNAISNRTNFPVNRDLLFSVLQKQYDSLEISDALKNNIDALKKDNCFSVCTAHQPNLGTGYLYFIYKIIHAIKLAAILNQKYPNHYFVPVYYMGSEDNDLQELGVFNYNQNTFRWDGEGQTGAFGRMNTTKLKPFLNSLFKIMGPPGAENELLQQLFTNAYLKHDTIAEATLYLINELFGTYGLVVLNPDNAALKSSFTSIMKDDLLFQTAFHQKENSINVFPEKYKEQAHVRPVNLFYLKDNLRERIEKKEEKWVVHGTTIQWTENEILDELNNHPEHFSPNVILRGLFQETILPNIVFIGGGSEVAYWLQLKKLFNYYNVFFPSIHLRQSVLFLDKKTALKLKKNQLNYEDIFKSKDLLTKEYIEQNSSEFKLQEELEILEKLMAGIQLKATRLESTLYASANAAFSKMRKQMDILQLKLYRAEKRKHKDKLDQFDQLKRLTYPSGILQERYENFITFYLKYGNAFFTTLLSNFDPFRNEFLILEEE